jgi:hypothetical protein
MLPCKPDPLTPFRPTFLVLSLALSGLLSANVLSSPLRSHPQISSYIILQGSDTMNAPQPSDRPLPLTPTCDSCRYCLYCDSKPGAPQHIVRFCEHGLESNFVHSRDCTNFERGCPATAPMRKRARLQQQLGNPPTAQSGQVRFSQP